MDDRARYDEMKNWFATRAAAMLACAMVSATAAADTITVCLDGSCDDSGELDCNGNGLLDVHEIVWGTASDCNGNLILDVCEYGVVEVVDFEGVPVSANRSATAPG
jgi:hypothetical protein